MVRALIDLPFEDFKWRWAEVMPSEGLNRPEVYLGVLRVLRKFEGYAKSDPAIVPAYQQVENDIPGIGVRLAHPPKRNLIRLARMYWRATGLLEDTRTKIVLSDFGRGVADGSITRSDFAASVIVNLELPNKNIEKQPTIDLWDSAGVKIKPLKLILDVIERLTDVSIHGTGQAFLTKEELLRVVIPLSGVSATIGEIASDLIEFRTSPTQFSHYPDCTPKPNDHRMANEFLLFLSHYGYLNLTDPGRFESAGADAIELSQLEALIEAGEIPLETAAATGGGTSGTHLRRRRMASVLSRPQQAKFRREVLALSGGACAVTAENVTETLEAAHVIPVSNDGSDNPDNGFCLRSDIHALFDSGHLRIDPHGKLHKSDILSLSPTYSSLPSTIGVPAYVNVSNIEWRFRYL